MEEKKSWQEWYTTGLGVLTFVFGMLVTFGVLTPDQTADLTEGLTSLKEIISGAIIAISGIVNVFRAK